MATRLDELYEQDFYLWTQQQAAVLKRLAQTRSNAELDFPHLTEELEDLGMARRAAIRSHLRRIIEHCLELDYSAARYARAGWRDSIIDARAAIQDEITPSLRRDLEERLPRLWTQARTKADNGLRGHRETDAADLLPAACPYALDELLTDDWYPANRRGLPDDR
jgi:Domain of unknown function DUF29